MENIKNIKTIFAALYFGLLFYYTPVFSKTLDDVVTRDVLQCGVTSSIPGFSVTQKEDNRKGFEVALCRAVAAAVLGNADKVRVVPLSDEDGIIALQSGAIDLLASAAWSQARDVALGVRFVGPVIMGDEGFLATVDFEYQTAFEGTGITICAMDDSVNSKNIDHYFSEGKEETNRENRILKFADMGQAVTAFATGRCELLFGFKPHLSGLSELASRRGETMLLPDIVAHEIRGMVVRKGDENWYDIVRWVRYGLIMAEEYGISITNIEKLMSEDDGTVAAMLQHNNYAGSLGLASDWMYQIIVQVGNFSDLWEENLGQKSSLKLDRGVNSLWINGGILYTPPLD